MRVCRFRVITAKGISCNDTIHNSSKCFIPFIVKVGYLQGIDACCGIHHLHWLFHVHILAAVSLYCQCHTLKISAKLNVATTIQLLPRFTRYAVHNLQLSSKSIYQCSKVISPDPLWSSGGTRSQLTLQDSSAPLNEDWLQKIRERFQKLQKLKDESPSDI